MDPGYQTQIPRYGWVCSYPSSQLASSIVSVLLRVWLQYLEI